MPLLLTWAHKYTCFLQTFCLSLTRIAFSLLIGPRTYFCVYVFSTVTLDLSLTHINAYALIFIHLMSQFV